MPQPPPSGWYVEIDSTSGGFTVGSSEVGGRDVIGEGGTEHVFTPTVVGEPTRKPRVNDFPRIEIPVHKNDKWHDAAFDDAPMRVWYDGIQQPIEQKVKTRETEEATVLVGRGGQELEERVNPEYDFKEIHLAARDLVQNNTTYTANVDAPETTTRDSVIVQTASSNSDFIDKLATAISDTDPIEIRNGNIELLQSGFVFEAETGSWPGPVERSHLSNGESADVFDSTHGASFNFTTEYDIPAADVRVSMRWRVSDFDWANELWQNVDIDYTLNGETYNFIAENSIGYNVKDMSPRLVEHAHKEVGGAFTDETTDSRNDTIDDMELLPSSPSVGDAFYFGDGFGPFEVVDVELTTPGAGTWDIVWEYWNGASWASISANTTGFSDGTADWTQDGQVEWDLRGLDDWATTDVNGDTAYWVRARLDSFSSMSTQPLGTRAFLHVGPIFWTHATKQSADLTAGSYTLSFDVTTSGATTFPDIVSVVDDRFTYTFDETVDEVFGHLDGPELYPDAAGLKELEFEDAETVDAVDGGRIEATLNSTGGGLVVGLSNDQGQTYTTENNRAAFGTDFAETGPSLRWKIQMSRTGTQEDTTPLSGHLGHVLSDYELRADLVDVPLLVNQTFDGQLVDVLREFANLGNFIFEFQREGGSSIEWTQPGQRTTTEDPNLGAFQSEKSTGEIAERAVVYGSSQRTIGENFTSNHGTAVKLNQDNLVETKESVRDPSTGTRFTRGSDYTMNYQAGEITTLSSGQMADSSTFSIDYSYRTKNTFTTSDVQTPTTVTKQIPSITTDRGCGIAAKKIVDVAKTPRRTAELIIPNDQITWSVVDSINPDEFPTGNTPLHIREIEHTPQQTVMILGNHRPVEVIVDDINRRVSRVSRHV